jgi:hypothetical protein
MKGGMTTVDIFIEIDIALTELIQIISSFEDEEINTVPSFLPARQVKGSWTAGQLARHLIISGSNFVELLNGPAIETHRKPDELVEGIRTRFLDFTIKMSSPDFVVPENINFKKVYLLNSLEKIKKEIKKAIVNLDLSKTCTAFEIPVLGFLTRLEAIYFVIYHSQRHIHQLKNLYKNLCEYNVKEN